MVEMVENRFGKIKILTICTSMPIVPHTIFENYRLHRKHLDNTWKSYLLDYRDFVHCENVSASVADNPDITLTEESDPFFYQIEVRLYHNHSISSPHPSSQSWFLHCVQIFFMAYMMLCRYYIILYIYNINIFSSTVISLN